MKMYEKTMIISIYKCLKKKVYQNIAMEENQ